MSIWNQGSGSEIQIRSPTNSGSGSDQKMRIPLDPDLQHGALALTIHSHFQDTRTKLPRLRKTCLCDGNLFMTYVLFIIFFNDKRKICDGLGQNALNQNAVHIKCIRLIVRSF
jgi:hypothetical protein